MAAVASRIKEESSALDGKATTDFVSSEFKLEMAFMKVEMAEKEKDMAEKDMAKEMAEEEMVEKEKEMVEVLDRLALMDLNAVANSQRAYLEALFNKVTSVLEQSKKVSAKEKQLLKTKMSTINIVVSEHWTPCLQRLYFQIVAAPQSFRK